MTPLTPSQGVIPLTPCACHFWLACPLGFVRRGAPLPSSAPGQKVSWCMQRLHLQVIFRQTSIFIYKLCLESTILLPLNYIRATGAHKPRQNGEPRQPRHLDTSTASTQTSTPRRHTHMESALTNLDRPRHKPRHRLDRGSTASTPRQPGLCATLPLPYSHTLSLPYSHTHASAATSGSGLRRLCGTSIEAASAKAARASGASR